MVVHKCDICLVYETSKKGNLNRHKQTCKEKPIFLCEKCLIYETNLKANLEIHINRCTIECVECHQIFANKKEHNAHYLKEHKSHSCSVCGKEFF